MGDQPVQRADPLARDDERQDPAPESSAQRSQAAEAKERAAAEAADPKRSRSGGVGVDP